MIVPRISCTTWIKKRANVPLGHLGRVGDVHVLGITYEKLALSLFAEITENFESGHHHLPRSAVCWTRHPKPDIPAFPWLADGERLHCMRAIHDCRIIAPVELHPIRLIWLLTALENPRLQMGGIGIHRE